MSQPKFKLGISQVQVLTEEACSLSPYQALLCTQPQYPAGHHLTIFAVFKPQIQVLQRHTFYLLKIYSKA